jgi:hypothetical protein
MYSAADDLQEVYIGGEEEEEDLQPLPDRATILSAADDETDEKGPPTSSSSSQPPLVAATTIDVDSLRGRRWGSTVHMLTSVNAVTRTLGWAVTLRAKTFKRVMEHRAVTPPLVIPAFVPVSAIPPPPPQSSATLPSSSDPPPSSYSPPASTLLSTQQSAVALSTYVSTPASTSAPSTFASTLPSTALDGTEEAPLIASMVSTVPASNSPTENSVPETSDKSVPVWGYLLCQFAAPRGGGGGAGPRHSEVSRRQHHTVTAVDEFCDDGVRRCTWRLCWGFKEGMYHLTSVDDLTSAAHVGHSMVPLPSATVRLTRIKDVPPAAWDDLVDNVKLRVPSESILKVYTTSTNTASTPSSTLLSTIHLPQHPLCSLLRIYLTVYSVLLVYL